jgi:CspA family cold shock protein
MVEMVVEMTGGDRVVPRPVGVDEAAQEVVGRVKWFDVGRGFGFVLSPEVERDILLHVNVLRGFGQSSVAEGAEVRMRVQRSARGFQATEVLAVVPPEPDEGADRLPEFFRPVPDGLPYEPARVKWFDKGKGFGFANVFGRTEDVFVHADVLRRYGLADLMPGEAMCLRVVDGARGKLAVEVRRWEDYTA